jgi:hypothetical protein
MARRIWEGKHFVVKTCAGEFKAGWRDRKIMQIELRHPGIAETKIEVDQFELQQILEGLLALNKDKP